MVHVFVGAALVFTFAAATPVMAAGKCSELPNNAALQALLVAAPGGSPNSPGGGGGLFNGEKMWGAIVNRDGEICSFIASTTNPTQAWPGSQAIAKAKAYTANAFSLDSLALSTARLYTFVQPGHSLFGLNNSNPFNPGALAPPKGSSGGNGQIAGGIITFGGGVPLYNAAGKIIGGLGISGDTACSDHEIAKKVRDLAGLNPPGGALIDDITYSSVDGATPFTHPLCPNTLRNNVFIGNELTASGY